MAGVEVKPVYVGMGPYPGWVGIVFDADTFRREMKRLGVENVPQFVNEGAHATTHNFAHPQHGEMNLVSLDAKAAKGRTRDEIYGLMVHEAVHCKQHVFAAIGETQPGAEQEAYLVQHIAQTFIRAWDERRDAPRSR